VGAVETRSGRRWGEMFRNARYVTRGVCAEIGPDVQVALWAMVDGLVGSGIVEPDYLQVFDLEVSSAHGAPVQAVVHRQEMPDYRRQYALHAGSPVSARVYVIDDGDHTTMLLAEEY